MGGFSKTEILLLEYLHRRDVDNILDLKWAECTLDLKEKDEINQVRELVFYIEKLEREGYVNTEEGFYKASENMSFVYLNSAIELYEAKIHLSDEGLKLMETYMQHHEHDGFFVSVCKCAQTREGKKALGFVAVVFFVLGILLGACFSRMFI